MEKYLILAHVGFDWSGGEYGIKYVDDILLGVEECENRQEAIEKAKILLEEYRENNSSIYGADFDVKRV